MEYYSTVKKELNQLYFNLKKKYQSSCCGAMGGASSAQWVKNPALLQLWHRSQLQLKFHLWPGNFHMPWVLLKKEKQKKMQSHKLCVIPTGHSTATNMWKGSCPFLMVRSSKEMSNQWTALTLQPQSDL